MYYSFSAYNNTQVLAVSAATSVHVWDVDSNKKLSGETKEREPICREWIDFEGFLVLFNL